jgi:hypothetical protein
VAIEIPAADPLEDAGLAGFEDELLLPPQAATAKLTPNTVAALPIQEPICVRLVMNPLLCLVWFRKQGRHGREVSSWGTVEVVA